MSTTTNNAAGTLTSKPTDPASTNQPPQNLPHQTPTGPNKGHPPIPPSRKRNNDVRSPPSADIESNKKSKNFNSETLNEEICRVQGMDYQRESFDTRLDKSELEERMLYNMNHCMREVQTYEVDGKGTSVGVNDFLHKVVPEIMSTMIRACAEQIDKTMTRWMQKMEEKKEQEIVVLGDQFQAQVMRLKYENDANEQYSRRESIKIFGIKEEKDEDVEKKAMDVFADAGVEVKPEDFQAIHRNGPPKKPGDTSYRPIMVTFVSRRKKQETMKKKKVLKEAEGYDKIYIHEDLTPLRSKLLKYIKNYKEQFNLKYVWTSEGRILCQPKYPDGLPVDKRPRVITVENPDELFKLGAYSIDYKALGLESYRFTDLA